MSEFEILEDNVSLNNLQMYQQDKAMLDMQISTAKAYPRDLEKIIRNSITVVNLSMEIAESCTYSITKGNKNISGPSVNLAKIIVHQMTNMRIDNRVVGYDRTHVTCEAICFDLEKNFAFRTQIKKSILDKYGTQVSEDMKVIIGNAGNAVALRNSVFTVVGREIIDHVYNKVKEKITGNISDETKFTLRLNTLFEGFKKRYHYLNLSDEEICKTVGKSSISHITKDDLVTLIGFENALSRGEQAPDTLFRPAQEQKFVSKPLAQDKSEERVITLINAAKNKKDLEKYLKDCKTEEQRNAYDEKFKTLK